jgi:hypothetical protein
MVKLVIQGKKEKAGIETSESSDCSVKVLDLFLWHPILVLSLGILGFVGKGAAPLVGHLEVEMLGGCFLFFPLSLVLWAVCYN